MSLEILKPVLTVCVGVRVCVCRLGAAPRRSARSERVHPVEPLRRPTVDAADPDGAERPSQRPAAYRGTQATRARLQPNDALKPVRAERIQFHSPIEEKIMSLAFLQA